MANHTVLKGRNQDEKRVRTARPTTGISGATRDEATERITFEADTTYLGQDFQLASVVSFIQANEQSRILSKQNAYSILERTFPDVISSFEDNEEQKLSDEDAGFSPVASMSNPLFSMLRQQGEGASEGQEETEENGEDEEGNEPKKKTS